MRGPEKFNEWNFFVLYFDKGKLLPGIVKNESYGKILIITEEGKEKFISESQILIKSKTREENLFEKIKKLKEEIDLKLIWEIALSSPDVREIDTKEMANIIFQKADAESVSAILLKLYSEENIYFKKKGEKWEVREEKDVEKIMSQRKIEEEEKRKTEEAKSWLSKLQPEIEKVLQTSLISFFNSDFPKYEEKIPDVVKEKLNEIKNGFINNEIKRTEILPYSREEDIFKILCFFGIIDPYDNFFIERFKINYRPLEFEIHPLEEFKKQKEKGEREKIKNPSYSIDLEGTEIRDDAFSKITENEIMVHIADATLLDNEKFIKEVIKRGKTIFFPEGKVDMLPQKVVKELSLDSKKLKPALTIKIKFSALGDKFEVKNVEIFKSEVEIEENFEFSNCDERVSEIIEFGKKLYEIRTEKLGGLDLISDDFAIFLKDKNIEVQRWRVNDSRIAVAEISMLCSHAIALFCKENNIPVFYRRSILPDEIKSKIKNFREQSKNMNFPRPYVLWKNIRAGRVIETTTTPSGAESIGYPLYAWGTSPLRRSWDFINIIQIGRFLDKKELMRKEHLDVIKDEIETTIGKIETAEDMRYRFLLCVYIIKKLKGKVIEGLVVERKDTGKEKQYVFWIDEIASFVKGNSEKDFDELQTVKLMLSANPLKLSISAKPI
ncbi:Ribonuclease R [bacterium HR19]|nr:Ribonuclease R [bacterium HR19]